MPLTLMLGMHCGMAGVYKDASIYVTTPELQKQQLGTGHVFRSKIVSMLDKIDPSMRKAVVARAGYKMQSLQPESCSLRSAERRARLHSQGPTSCGDCTHLQDRALHQTRWPPQHASAV